MPNGVAALLVERFVGRDVRPSTKRTRRPAVAALDLSHFCRTRYEPRRGPRFMVVADLRARSGSGAIGQLLPDDEHAASSRSHARSSGNSLEPTSQVVVRQKASAHGWLYIPMASDSEGEAGRKHGMGTPGGKLPMDAMGPYPYPPDGNHPEPKNPGDFGEPTRPQGGGERSPDRFCGSTKPTPTAQFHAPPRAGAIHFEPPGGRPGSCTVGGRAPVRLCLLVAVGLLLAGCGDGFDPRRGAHRKSRSSAAARGERDRQRGHHGSCTTTVVKGLATQLVEEISASCPGTMKPHRQRRRAEPRRGRVPLPPDAGGGRAHDAQKAATSPSRSTPGSARSQQFFSIAGTRRAAAASVSAATPGTSNRSAIAVDVQDNAAWRSALQNVASAGSARAIRFTTTSRARARSTSVASPSRPSAQRNRNHPDDKIGEDGQFAAQRPKRLNLAREQLTGATIAPATTMPPPIHDVPESPDAEEPSTTTSEEQERQGGDGDGETGESVSASARPARTLGATCTDRPAATGAPHVLGAVMMAVRRRAR